MARFVLGLAFLFGAVLLAQPAPRQPQRLTWDALLQPLAVGRPIALGYVLGSPRRGEEHDIVFTARSTETGSAVEVHVLDRGRWQGIRETASFGVAYETPRSAARIDDCETVTEALAQAIRANDPGGLGPVDVIPLRSEPEAPRIARVLDTLVGTRGVALGVCLAGLTWVLAAARGGAWAVSVWLMLLGLLLRAPSLSVPFAHDQDVQRLFTGHLPLAEILFGQGLEDRHPPLYFLVLHVAQLFGQSEAVVRAPAVLFGALVGPAVVWGARVLGRRIEVAALAGLIAIVSLELVARSREVSSIPLLAVLAIVMSVSLVTHAEMPSRKWGVVVAVSHALALWTYYLAPFVIVGNVAVLLGLRRLPRATGRVLGIGLVLGAPALVLAVVTFFRDRAARTTASAHPSLAWGERGAPETLRLLGVTAVSAFGIVFLLVLAFVVIDSARKRDAAVLAPVSGFLAALVGIAALAPLARVQPYYLVAALPLTALAVGLGLGSFAGARAWPGSAALGLVAAVTAVPSLRSARTLYLPDSDAFMPGFADIIMEMPERRIVTVAHYDGTLLAYYLGRRAGVPMDWARMQPEQGEEAHVLVGVDRVLEPLAQAHSLALNPDTAALDRLEALLQRERVLVIEREGFRLVRVSERLRRCTVLSEAGTGRLYRCSRGR